MNKVIALSFGLILSTVSFNSLAASEVCRKMEKQCEQALKLKDALVPQLSKVAQGARAAYTTGYNMVSPLIPAAVYTNTRTLMSPENVKFWVTNAVLAGVAFTAVKVLQAVTAIPMFLVKLPFRNRVTMFCTGVVAKIVYDAYTTPVPNQVP